MCREMVDAMQDRNRYNYAFSIGWLYSYVLTVPHSVAVNMAYPDEIAYNGALTHMCRVPVSAWNADSMSCPGCWHNVATMPQMCS